MSDFSTARFSPGLVEVIGSLASGTTRFDQLEPKWREQVVAFFRTLYTSEPPGPDVFRTKLYEQLGRQPETVLGIIKDMMASNVVFEGRDRTAFFAWLGRVEGETDRQAFPAILDLVPEPLRDAYVKGAARLFREFRRKDET